MVSGDLGDIVNLNLLNEAKRIRAYDLEVSRKNLSESSKEMHLEAVRNKVNSLVDKYADVEGPEKDYLVALAKYYKLAEANSLKSSDDSKVLERTIEKNMDVLSIPINELDLSTAARNSLKAYLSINNDSPVYFGEVLKIDRNEFLRIRNFGKRSFDRLKAFAEKNGFRLGEEIEFDAALVRAKEEIRRTPSDEERRKLDTPLSELNFSSRVYNNLVDRDTLYLGELIQWSEKQLKGIRKFGTKSINEIRDILTSAGYNFGEKINYVNPEERKKQQEEADMQKKLIALDQKIADLDISVRVYNCFSKLAARNGHDTMYFGEIVSMTQKELLELSEFGKISLKEIKELVQGFGFELGNPGLNYIRPEKREQNV